MPGPAQPKLAAMYAAQGGFAETPEQVGAVFGPQYWMVSPRGNGMAYGPESFDMFGVPKPDKVVFTLRGGRLTDYLANIFAWRLCSESLMRLLDAEQAAEDDIGWIPVQVDAGTKRQRYFLFRAKPRPDLLHRTTIASPSGHPIKPVLDRALAKEHRVFLLDELGVAIIVSEEVKQKIKSAKLSGMYFHPIRAAT